MAAPSDKRLVNSLMKRVRAYEKWFKQQEAAGEQPNHQAHTAYLNLVKLVHAIGPGVTDNTAPTGRNAKEILRDIYGIDG